MKVLYLLASLAVASATPMYYRRNSPQDLMSPYFSDGIFDTNSFWSQLDAELRGLDQMLKDFSKHFPTTDVPCENVEGNEYKLKLTLTGFKEDEITVKARSGLLMIQATHQTESGGSSFYQDLRTLPSNVNPSGSWTYENNVLTIIFPLNTKLNEPKEPTATEKEEASREEMGSDATNVSQEIEVGLVKTEKPSIDLRTNEIPTTSPIEATTYAVDFNNEVEFVPIRY